MTDIHLKQLSVADWEIFRDIRLKALKSDPGVFGANFADSSKKTPREWQDMLRNPNTAVFVICDHADIIGLTAISIDKDDPTETQALLWASWLEPEYRGKGISNLMYQTRLDWAREHPTCEKITVAHRASNLVSKYANQKHGFVFTHLEQQQWPDGKIEESHCYELNIKSREASP